MAKNKRKIKRNLKHISEVEDMYKIINKVQITMEPLSFVLDDISLKEMIENIIKDAGLTCDFYKYKKKDMIKINPGTVDYNKDIEVENIEEEDFFNKDRFF